MEICRRFFIYTPESKRSFKTLINGSIPICIASATAAFVTSIIEYIAEDHEDKHASECGQVFVYAIITYVGGKILTYKLHQAIHTKEKRNAVVEWIVEKDIQHLLFGLFAENSGFAWKEFGISLALKLIYLEHGWGAAFGSWCLSIAIFSIVTTLSGLFFRLWFHDINHKLAELFVEFDADSFALALAFVITSLWGIGIDGLGVGYINHHSYLYEWADDETDDGYSGVNSYYLLYTFCITSLVSVILVVEERCGLEDNKENEELHLEDKSDSQTSIMSGPANTLDHAHISIRESFFELWHNFLGCLCGVAYYVLLIDYFMAYGGHSLFGRMIVALVCALIVTWRVPSCMGSHKEKQMVMRHQLEKQQEAKKKVANEIESPQDVNVPTTTNPEKPKKNCFSGLFAFWDSVMEIFLHYKFHRRGITLIAARLCMGWIWETFITDLLYFITDENELSLSHIAAVDLGILVIIVIVGYITNRLVKDLDKEALQLDIERLRNDASAAINAASDNADDNAITQVENPLQQVESMERNSSS